MLYTNCVPIKTKALQDSLVHLDGGLHLNVIQSRFMMSSITLPDIISNFVMEQLLSASGVQYLRHNQVGSLGRSPDTSAM